MSSSSLVPPPPRADSLSHRASSSTGLGTDRRHSSTSRRRGAWKVASSSGSGGSFSRRDSSNGRQDGSRPPRLHFFEGREPGSCHRHRRMCRACSACNPGEDRLKQMSMSTGSATPRSVMSAAGTWSQKSLTEGIRSRQSSSSPLRRQSSSPLQRMPAARLAEEARTRLLPARAQQQSTGNRQQTRREAESPLKRSPSISGSPLRCRKTVTHMSHESISIELPDTIPAEVHHEESREEGETEDADAQESQDDDDDDADGQRSNAETEGLSPHTLTELALEKSRRLLELLANADDSSGAAALEARRYALSASGQSTPGEPATTDTATKKEQQTAQVPVELLRMISDLWEQMLQTRDKTDEAVEASCPGSADDAEQVAEEDSQPLEAQSSAVDSPPPPCNVMSKPIAPIVPPATHPNQASSFSGWQHKSVAAPVQRQLQGASSRSPTATPSTASCASCCSSLSEPHQCPHHHRDALNRAVVAAVGPNTARLGGIRAPSPARRNVQPVLTERPAVVPSRHPSPAAPRVFTSWSPQPKKSMVTTPATSPGGGEGLVPGVGSAASSPSTVPVQSPRKTATQLGSAATATTPSGPSALGGGAGGATLPPPPVPSRSDKGAIAPSRMSMSVTPAAGGVPHSPHLYEWRTVAVTTIHHFLRMA